MAEGIPEHEPTRTTPERPSADLQLGLGRRIYDNQAARHDSRRTGDGPAEVVNARFDRIEDRLESLERMLRELITTRAEPRMDGARPTASEQPVAVPAVSQVAAPIPAAPVPAWEPSSDDEELDESVREYVDRLLKRDEAKRVARRVEPPQTPPTKPSASSLRPRADDEAAVAKPPAAAMAPAAAEPPVSIPPMVAPSEELPDTASLAGSLPVRRPRPDHDVNLEAMRLVANLSATAAIRTYEKSQAARKTMDRLPLLLIGVVCGLMLLYTAWSSGASAMLVGAGVAFVGAALTAWQLLFILFRWLAASRPVRDP